MVYEVGEVKTAIEKSFEKITSLDEARNYIDDLDKKIVDALAKRSRYPICKNLFDYSSREKSLGLVDENINPQRELELLGIHTIWWYPFYSRIVEKICRDGELLKEDLNNVLEAERNLEALVYERIMISEKLAEIKLRENLPTENKDREEKIIKNVRKYAEKKGLNPDIVEEIYREILIEANKDAQEIYRKIFEQRARVKVKSRY